MMADKTVRVRIEGRVQGVWYRAWTTDQAIARGLNGWVRNMSDGSVEAVFSGPQDKVDEMLKICHEGPLMARVDAVTTQHEPGSVEPGFKHRSIG